MNIRCALIGMPGSGKSTVGEHLAQRAGVPFVDLDHRLEQELGISIRQFFETEGEARFRDKEAAILAIMASMPGGVFFLQVAVWCCGPKTALCSLTSSPP